MSKWDNLKENNMFYRVGDKVVCNSEDESLAEHDNQVMTIKTIDETTELYTVEEVEDTVFYDADFDTADDFNTQLIKG